MGVFDFTPYIFYETATTHQSNMKLTPDQMMVVMVDSNHGDAIF